MDPRKVIKSTIAIVQATTSQYEQQIEDIADLPDEFSIVNRHLPLAKFILRHARDNSAWDESSKEIIQPLATSLERKAKMLQKVFSEVGKEMEKDTRDGSILDCYRDTLLNLGKSYRVEALMLGILKDLESLFTNQSLNPENDKQTAELKDAIDAMSKVKSSVPDSEIKNTGANFTQNIASGGTGHQAHYSGRGHHINTGSGAINNYHATTISFVPSNQDERSWRGEGPDRNASHHIDGNNRNQKHDPRVVGHDQLQRGRDGVETVSETINEGIASHQDGPCRREDFQIAIICALPLEYDAICLLFDQFWGEDESYGRARGDMNVYTTGRMNRYDVVLALLPNMGTVAAAGAAASFRSSYPCLQLAFLVGICGGVPGESVNEIHLGDVVISKSTVQYDLGKQYHNTYVIKDTVDNILGRPNKNIRSLVASFETEYMREKLQENACSYLKALQHAAVHKRRRYSYQYPGVVNDKLFAATYRHKHRGIQPCSIQPCSICDNQIDGFCEDAARASCVELGCDESQLVKRTGLEMRDSKEQCPEIFVGRIASGNIVMKSGEHRDQIAHQQNVIALEMEGAGVWDEIPCIVVKGVCDYADSHKNDLWQRYAAAAAASVMKAVLGRYPMTDR